VGFIVGTVAAYRIGLDDGAPAGVIALLLETALILEDRERATLLAQALTPIAHVAATQENTTCVGRLLGGASALLGSGERARAHYEQALAVAARVNNRPELALTHLQLAELLLPALSQANDPGRGRSELAERTLAAPQGREGQEDRAEALSHLDQAIAEFRAMKMQPSLERALGHKGLLKA
jgi:hypothetical protein